MIVKSARVYTIVIGLAIIFIASMLLLVRKPWPSILATADLLHQARYHQQMSLLQQFTDKHFNALLQDKLSETSIAQIKPTLGRRLFNQIIVVGPDANVLSSIDKRDQTPTSFASDPRRIDKIRQSAFWEHLQQASASRFFGLSDHPFSERKNIVFAAKLLDADERTTGVIIGSMSGAEFLRQINRFHSEHQFSAQLDLKQSGERHVLSYHQDAYTHYLEQRAPVFESSIGFNELKILKERDKYFLLKRVKLTDSNLDFEYLFQLENLTFPARWPDLSLSVSGLLLLIFLSWLIKKDFILPFRQIRRATQRLAAELQLREKDPSLLVKKIRDQVRKKDKNNLNLRSHSDLLLSTGGFDVFRLDLTSNIIHFIQRWGSVIGLAADQRIISIAAFLERIHPDDRDKVRRKMGDLRKRHLGVQDMCTYRIKHESGDYIQVKTLCQTYEGDKFGESFVLGLNVDLSNEFGYRTRLQNLERTTKIQHNQLRLQIAEKDAMLAHSITNQEMNLLMLLIKNIMASLVELDQEIISTSDELITHDLRITTHLVTLLSLMQIKIDRFKASVVKFNVRMLCKEIERRVTTMANESNMMFKLDIDQDVPSWLRGDKEKLAFCLYTLAISLIELNTKGLVALFISRLDDNPESTNCCLQFSVTDTNSELTVDEVSQIFRWKKDFGNNKQGLQLLQYFIVARMVSLMGGKITASKNGQSGMTFTFNLDFSCDNEIEKDFTRKQSSNHLDEELTNLRLLVVDDSEINLQVLQELVSKLGIDADFCEDGSEAIDAVQQKIYDVILMDLEMQTLGGIEATEKIRQFSIYKSTPIIALTAYDSIEVKTECLKAGMNGFIQKPIDETQLKATLSMWGGKSKDITDNLTPAIKLDEEEQDSSYEVDELKPGYIDREKAIENLGGHEEGFIKLLQIFKKNYSSVPNNDFEGLKDANRFKKFTHTLISSAEYIGACFLAELAKKANYLDIHSIPADEPLLVQLQDELVEILKQVNLLLDKET